MFFRSSIFPIFAFLAVAPMLPGCRMPSVSDTQSAKSKPLCPKMPYSRNWQQFPTLERISGVQAPLYVMGDVHGRFNELLELLTRAQVATGTPDKPIWLGQNAVLVFIGDLMNKGKQSLEVVRFVMNLQRDAAQKGGKVIAMMGNHEIAFLDDPGSSKSEELRANLDFARMNICKDFYSPASPYGAWIRNMPAAAMINAVMISHTGYAYESYPDKWDEKFREIVQAPEWSKAARNFACGKDKKGEEKQGFFSATAWWGKNGEFFRAQQNVLKTRAVIFGHDPSAFEEKGKIAGYFGDANGTALIKIDTGLGDLVSRGSLLKCAQWLPNGACARFEVLTNPINSKTPNSKFELLQISPSAPPKEDAGPADRGC